MPAHLSLSLRTVSHFLAPPILIQGPSQMKIQGLILGSHFEIGTQAVSVSPPAEVPAPPPSRVDSCIRFVTAAGGLIQFTSSQFQSTLTQFNKRLFN